MSKLVLHEAQGWYLKANIYGMILPLSVIVLSP